MRQRKLTCGSLFSGIAGFDEGFRREGFETKWFAEREPFCHSVLTTHFPNVPIFNDVLTVGAHNLERVDCITGGFPCQDLSVAGERAGLAGARSGLFFEFARVVAELKPKWFVCENVPGLFSSSEGRDFDLVVEAFSKLGYGVAWRTLDSQFFGVAQRRRRVFIVGCLGDGRSAAEILFEPKGVCRDYPPSREKGQRVAPTISARPSGGGGLGTDFDLDGGLISGVTHSLRADGFEKTYQCNCGEIFTDKYANDIGGLAPAECPKCGEEETLTTIQGPGTPLVPVAFAQNTRDEVRLFGGDGQTVGALAAEPGMKQTTYIAFSAKDHGADATEDLSPTLRAGGHSKSHANAGVMPAVAFGFSAGQSEGAGTIAYQPEMSPTLRGASSGTNQVPALHSGMAVRRLTPVECERLQSFPDNWTNVLHRGKPAADGPRYKALGNAVTVNVASYIAKRIRFVNGNL